MKSTRFPYSRFQTFCLRLPLFPVELFLSLTASKSVDDNILKLHYSNPIINESIYLASPQFHLIMGKWVNGQIYDENKSSRIRKTFIKYLIRLSTRCTPFGLFAGCSSGIFSRKTEIVIDDRKNHNRHSKLDMHFLVRLAKSLEDHPEIRENLTYKPNSSLYQIGNRFRYVEIEFKDSKRQYNLESFATTSEIVLVLNTAHSGKKKSELIQVLIREGYANNEANEIVNQLIEHQILVSDLSPNVTGPDFADNILEKLRMVQSLQEIAQKLTSILSIVRSLDQNLGNKIESYYDIRSLVQNLGVPFNPKYLVQTDLFPKTKTNKLSHSITRKIKRGIWVLKKTSNRNEPKSVTDFKERFLNRFENQRVPLLYALDVETGVGYIRNPRLINPLVLFQDIEMPEPKLGNIGYSFELSPFQEFIAPKILEALRKNDRVLNLKHSDIESLDLDWNDAPNTISVVAQVLKIGNTKKVFLKSCGAFGCRLLARFSNGDENIRQLVENIIRKEIEISKNKILAEIVHLPEDRTGNILRRPHLYEFELPYVGRSTLGQQNIIDLTDLDICINNNEIILISRKLNSRIIPRLTSAHYYRNSSIPVYQFLCDLQYQNIHTFRNIWGDLKKLFVFFPRLIYEDVILSKAQWKLDIDNLKTNFDKSKEKVEMLSNYLKQLEVPKYISVLHGDNKLSLNICNMECLEILNEFLNKDGETWIEEAFLDLNELVVHDLDGNYVNEVIIPFYKEY